MMYKVTIKFTIPADNPGQLKYIVHNMTDFMQRWKVRFVEERWVELPGEGEADDEKE